ncbi:NfeD family protein [Megalodesulfovibrio paquesii]
MSSYFLLLAASALLALANYLLKHFGVGERAWPPAMPEDGSRLFSFANAARFLAGFGLAGWMAEGLQADSKYILAVAAGGGVLAVWLASRFSLARLFGQGQTYGRMADALGHDARVTVTIGPNRSRRGKILAPLRDGMQEFPATTNAPEAIPAQARVVVTGVESGVFVVMPRQ